MIAALALLLMTAGAVEEDPRFQEARRLFERSELDDALARFNLVLLNDALPAKERALVLLWKGLAEAGLGRSKEALKAFERALLLDEDAALPIEAEPRVLELLEKARERAREHEPPPARVATRRDGSLYPSGPGVLIKTTPAGRMDAAVQDEAALLAPPVGDERAAAFPWLLVAGGTSAGLGALALGAGGLAASFALHDHARAVEARGAKEATQAESQAEVEALVAAVLCSVGGALLVAGAVSALAGTLMDGAE